LLCQLDFIDDLQGLYVRASGTNKSLRHGVLVFLTAFSVVPETQILLFLPLNLYSKSYPFQVTQNYTAVWETVAKFGGI